MIVIILGISLGILTIFYVTCLWTLQKGLGKLQRSKSDNQPFVSIVVAARNEESNIKDCLSSLMNQDYPSDRYEIVVVDDRSQDKTATIVKAWAAQFPQIKLVQIKDRVASVAPKKRALDIGIKNSRGEIILTTDADCRPQPGWVSGMVGYFEPEVGLVAGFSPLQSNSENHTLFDRIMAVDSLSLACVAAGSTGLGFPLTCTGRNLAYRRQTYDEVGGFSRIAHLISGDDDLLLHQIQDRTNWKICYSINPGTLVPAKPPQSIRAFINQRIRHASKGKYYSGKLKIPLILIYLFNLLLLVLLSLSLVCPEALMFVMPSFILKSGSEFFLLRKGTHVFQRPQLIRVFPLVAILHVPYVVLFGALGQLGKFHWKGETFTAQLKGSLTI